MNLCGVLVHAHPRDLDRISGAISAMAGAEIHAVTGDGRLVVTMEDTAAKTAADSILDLHRLDGVLSAALVYHHCDTEQATASSRPLGM